MSARYDRFPATTSLMISQLWWVHCAIITTSFWGTEIMSQKHLTVEASRTSRREWQSQTASSHICFAVTEVKLMYWEMNSVFSLYFSPFNLPPTQRRQTFSLFLPADGFVLSEWEMKALTHVIMHIWRFHHWNTSYTTVICNSKGTLKKNAIWSELFCFF